VIPQHECATCAATKNAGGAGTKQRQLPQAFVYALGRLEPRFPRLGVEKEYEQARAGVATAGLTDRQALNAFLAAPEHRYLARELCWVFNARGLDSYIVAPTESAQLDLFIEALRLPHGLETMSVMIGTRGPLAPASLCNGLTVPIVRCDHMYTFRSDELFASIPSLKQDAKFSAAANELFWRIFQLTENLGASDEHRALNYLCVRYGTLYAKAAEAFGRNMSLTSIDTVASALSGSRRLIDVVFTFAERQTGFLERFAVRVDVTDKYPFLAAPWSAYYNR
jgi:hypothetical protein